MKSASLLRERAEVRVLFLPDGPAAPENDRRRVEAAFKTGCLDSEGRTIQVVRNRQVHSNTIVRAKGPRATDRQAPQEADGLQTTADQLALCVYTADCVPILLSGKSQMLAIHAGWRGLAAGIVGKAVALLEEPGAAHAWIGPAIRACCYEVDEDVARRVAEATGPEVIVGPPGHPKPHLDLQAAAHHSLECGGLSSIETIPMCTLCDDAKRWASYRRDGPGGGRNLALIWRQP